ncbi:MAG: Ig-like domain-containing protein, partial [Muribaculaceae bacterium]|nr:Ig-like domain-containing protein [Muribaculaceae bacterium]
IYVGGTETLTATITPSDVIIKTLSWTSSAPNVATVDQAGKVTAKALGTAVITATTTDGTNLSASCTVTVKGITSITLNKNSTSIYVGGTETLTATITPSNVIIKTLLWTSSNSNVASVDQAGKVTAKALGTAVITATTTDGTNLSASCTVNVVPEYELLISPNIAHVRGVNNCTYELAISMNNHKAISGLQFVMNLPPELSLMTDSHGDYEVWLDDNRKARNHSISVEAVDNNQYLMLISSPTNQTFKGNSGDILHLKVKVNDKYHSDIGDKYLTLSSIIMAEADETQHNVSSSQSKLRLSYLVGDANADLHVDVTDYVVTANYILGRNTGPRFFTDAANAAFTDNSINVTDLVAITNIALEIREKEYRPDINGYQLIPVETMVGSDFELNAKVTEKIANQTIVTIAVDNDEPIAAMQLDLDLPDGISFVGADVTERSRGMSASCGTSPDGKARVLLSAFSDTDIASGSGDVLKLTLQGSAHNGDLLHLTDIMMTERNLIEHGATGELSIDLNSMTGLNEMNYNYINIYSSNGAVIIESPVEGKAQLVWVNGISQMVAVQPGRNVYPINVSYGDIIIVYFNGKTVKLQF